MIFIILYAFLGALSVLCFIWLSVWTLAFINELLLLYNRKLSKKNSDIQDKLKSLLT